MGNGGKHGKRTVHLVVRSAAVSSPLSLITDPHRSRTVELSPNHLMIHHTRRTRLSSFLCFLANDILLLFFLLFAYTGPCSGDDDIY
jgi:hypothetical protein